MRSTDDFPRRGIVIAIDGPAASGKSSTAHWVAKRLGLRHLDSGSLYRAATAAALRSGTAPERWSPEAVLAASTIVRLELSDSAFVPYLAGEESEDELRSVAVTREVSRVAQMQPVREWVNAHMRRMADQTDLVVDGRDMGTAVFPHADLKVYLVADPWERARRRLTQRLRRLPTDEETAEETDRLVHRDALDATQSVQARDAVLLDTTFLTQEEQVERIVALAKAATQRDPESDE